METNFINLDEIGNITEIIQTLNDMSGDAQKMLGQINLYDVNGDPLGVIEWRDDEFVLSLHLEFVD